jgi:hypothetical protein
MIHYYLSIATTIIIISFCLKGQVKFILIISNKDKVVENKLFNSLFPFYLLNNAGLSIKKMEQKYTIAFTIYDLL